MEASMKSDRDNRREPLPKGAKVIFILVAIFVILMFTIAILSVA